MNWSNFCCICRLWFILQYMRVSLIILRSFMCVLLLYRSSSCRLIRVVSGSSPGWCLRWTTGRFPVWSGWTARPNASRSHGNTPRVTRPSRRRKTPSLRWVMEILRPEYGRDLDRDWSVCVFPGLGRGDREVSGRRGRAGSGQMESSAEMCSEQEPRVQPHLWRDQRGSHEPAEDLRCVWYSSNTQ